MALLDALDIDAPCSSAIRTAPSSRAAPRLRPERGAGLVVIGTGATTKITDADDLQAALSELADPLPEPFAREFRSGAVYRPVPAELFDRIMVYQETGYRPTWERPEWVAADIADFVAVIE